MVGSVLGNGILGDFSIWWQRWLDGVVAITGVQSFSCEIRAWKKNTIFQYKYTVREIGDGMSGAQNVRHGCQRESFFHVTLAISESSNIISLLVLRFLLPESFLLSAELAEVLTFFVHINLNLLAGEG